jgi:hypothetical protein
VCGLLHASSTLFPEKNTSISFRHVHNFVAVVIVVAVVVVVVVVVVVAVVVVVVHS